MFVIQFAAFYFFQLELKNDKADVVLESHLKLYESCQILH